MVTIRYRNESPPLIGMHNSCQGNRRLVTGRVTGSVDSCRGDEEGEDETVSQRQTDITKHRVCFPFFYSILNVEQSGAPSAMIM